MTHPRILTGPDAELVRAEARYHDAALLQALVQGEVLHYPDEANHFNAARLKAQGLRLRTRKAPQGGRYWWVESITP
jgi:hypothetical protein